MMKKKSVFLLLVVIGNAYTMDARKTIELQDTQISADEICFNPRLNQLAIVKGNEVSLHGFTLQGKIIKETDLIYKRNNSVRDINFDCFGKYIATCGLASDRIYIYSTETAETISITTLDPRYLQNIAFHPQKRMFMVLGADDNLSTHSMNKHGLIEKTEKYRTPFRTRFCHKLFSNSAGQYVVLSKKVHDESNSLYVCTINSPEQKTIKSQDSEWYNMCLDPVHNRVALAGDDKCNEVIDIYDLNNQQLLSKLQCGVKQEYGLSNIASMNFDKTGKYLALGCNAKKKIIVYDVDSEKIIHTYEDESKDRVENIIFSPDGKFLLTRIDVKNLARTIIFVAQLPQS